jgi:polyphosphate kinase
MLLSQLDFPHLKYQPWSSITHSKMKALEHEDEPQSIFKLLKKNDVLVHHPYESFMTSVVRF